MTEGGSAITDDVQIVTGVFAAPVPQSSRRRAGSSSPYAAKSNAEPTILPEGETSQGGEAAQVSHASVFTSDWRERLHKQGFADSEDVKKSLRLLSEVRLAPREEKPCGFVFFCPSEQKKMKKTADRNA